VSTQLLLSGHDFLMAENHALALDPNAPANITICIDSAKTVLVPQELYEPALAEGYMAVNDKAVDDDECIVTARKGEIVALMAVSRRLVQAFDNQSWKVTYTSPLLDGIVSYTKAVRIKTIAQNTYVTISDNGSLQYAEVFATTDPTNIAFVMNKLGEVFKLNRYEIRVSGENAGEIVENLKDAFNNCKEA